MDKNIRREQQEQYEACAKLAIDRNNTLILYPDQQRVLIDYCKRDVDKGQLIFGGTREDGEQILVTISFEENAPRQNYMEDFENALCTLASLCSKTGKEKLDSYTK